MSITTSPDLAMFDPVVSQSTLVNTKTEGISLIDFSSHKPVLNDLQNNIISSALTTQHHSSVSSSSPVATSIPGITFFSHNCLHMPPPRAFCVSLYRCSNKKAIAFVFKF